MSEAPASPRSNVAVQGGMVVQLPQHLPAGYGQDGLHKPNLDDIDTALFEADNQLRLLSMLAEREAHRRRIVNSVVSTAIVISITAGVALIYSAHSGTGFSSEISISAISLIQIFAAAASVALSIWAVRSATNVHNLALIEVERARLMRALEIAKDELDQVKRDHGGVM